MSTRQTRLIAEVVLGMLVASLQAAPVADFVIQRNGTLKVTQPDGTVITAKKNDSLPAHLSGSIIEILDGRLDVATQKGFVQVVSGKAVARVAANDRVIVSKEKKTGATRIQVQAGSVDLMVGGTAAKLNKGSTVLVVANPDGHEVEISSLKGKIEVVTLGVKTLIAENSKARILTDPKTGTVRVEDTFGDVSVVQNDGKAVQLARMESVETKGNASGETLTSPDAGETFMDRPSEPQRPEASRYRP